MTSKNALYALAVILLTGFMAVAAFADVPDRELYDPSYSSGSVQPGQDMEQADEGAIREPMETGAVPDRPESSSDLNCCKDSGESTVEFGGLTFRPGIDSGP